jgi:hypothetical protein
VLLLLYIEKRQAAARDVAAATPGEKLADGCARVYVDYGSNAGLQIRKLYEYVSLLRCCLSSIRRRTRWFFAHLQQAALVRAFS